VVAVCQINTASKEQLVKQRPVAGAPRKAALARCEISSHAALLRLTVRRHEMGLGTILLIILVLMLIGALPSWPHSRGWGYGPSGGLGLVVVILIVLLLMGRI